VEDMVALPGKSLNAFVGFELLEADVALVEAVVSEFLKEDEGLNLAEVLVVV
jgi:hypothetical protein